MNGGKINCKKLQIFIYFRNLTKRRLTIEIFAPTYLFQGKNRGKFSTRNNLYISLYRWHVFGFYAHRWRTDFSMWLKKGIEYMRKHMRFYDAKEDIVYWYHGIKLQGSSEEKLFASEFGDDFDAIPAYEQIYALGGLSLTYRVNLDARILNDIELTLKLFEKFYFDKEREGYFTHLDPLTLDPRAIF